MQKIKQISNDLKRRMASSGMVHRVALVRTGVTEELSAFILRVTRIGELGTTLAITSNRRTLRRNTKLVSPSETSVLTRATRRNIPEDVILHDTPRSETSKWPRRCSGHLSCGTDTLITRSYPLDVRSETASRLRTAHNGADQWPGTYRRPFRGLCLTTFFVYLEAFQLQGMKRENQH
jgi:hypothetical protein